MATIKHLLFDNDGTIVDSEIIAVRIILRMLAPLGFQMQEEEYCQRFPGLLTRDILVILKDEYGLRLPDNFIHALHTEHERLFDSELRVVPGMHGLFRKLKTPKSMVSNGSVRHVEKCLRRVRLYNALNGRIFSAEHVERPKPFSDLYTYALEQIQHMPSEVLVIEDSPTGVIAAKEAGLTVIGLLGASHIYPGHGKKLKQAGADILVQNAGELAAELRKHLVQ